MSNQSSAIFYRINGIPEPEFDEKQAERAVKGYIDYFCGRAIKMDLSKDEIDPCCYDRDCTISCKEIIEKMQQN